MSLYQQNTAADQKQPQTQQARKQQARKQQARKQDCPLCQLHQNMQELLPQNSAEQNNTLKTLASIWCNPASSRCRIMH